MLTFASLLDITGISPADVRLLRHQDNRYPGNPTPYVLWRDDRDRFEAYQSTQAFGDEARLRASYWASFVGVPKNETLFVGLYSVDLVGALPADQRHVITGDREPAGSCNLYSLSLSPALKEYSGRLWIEWGKGYRAWIQRAEKQPKIVVELRRAFSEPQFPGYSEFIRNLSEIETLPASWAAALAATRGVYLLTCPKTREQYVGVASGAGGLLARWREYASTGHGGNVALKSRDRSDYQVSILQTVGSAATDGDLLALEGRWKDKLQSREMGLNRNR